MSITQKTFSRYKQPLEVIPNLVKTQIDSYQQFIEQDLQASISEFLPITDYAGKKFSLEFLDYQLVNPDHDEFWAKENKKTYQAELRARVKLTNKVLNTEKEQVVFLSHIPLMTDHGTFVFNGSERVIVPQLARSYGIFFVEDNTKKGIFFGAKIIPSRGAWIDMMADKDDIIFVRIDRKRKFPVTELLRVFGLETNEDIVNAFEEGREQEFIRKTLAKDSTTKSDHAFVDIYQKLRDGEQVSVNNARDFVNDLFSENRYDLSEVGRFQFNKRFGGGTEKEDLEQRLLSLDDLLTIIKHVIHLNVSEDASADDVDHLGSRRVRYAGELIKENIRRGMAQMKRNIQDRMSTIDTDTKLPIQIINQRPLQARIKEFFSTNQLSQFMDQENILSEIEHVRMLSALGKGGLTRERAGFEVRDIHSSHYGRICPVHTPEGPNIGLVLHLSLYARINNFGMIETPYVKVEKGVITGEVEYFNAYEEEKYIIAAASTAYDEKGKILQKEVNARKAGDPTVVSPKEIDYIDVATNQMFSVASALIPFISNDAANRALMGSNMMKQATPCIRPQAPLVGTGIESQVASDTGRLAVAQNAGEVLSVDARQIVVKEKSGQERIYKLINYSRTNDYSVMHQRPIVSLGQKVKRGDVLADASTSDRGQLAVGQNLLVAFMCWRGNNFEDAIIISERLVKDSMLTSIRIHEHECVVRDTKLGAEMTTPDIPNVGEAKLRNLDEDGIIRIGAEVRGGDILVGKISPKGEQELTPEERLLRSIFGEKARDVKDTSKRMGARKSGRVIGVKIFSREAGHDLEAGVLKKIYVEVAELRHIQVGDKIAGRHGNKGVISVVLPEEDMPYMEDGTPIDVVLTPLGVPSRMNLGQILEMHLGLAAHTLGYQAVVPPFAEATTEEIKDELEKAGFDRSGKVTLYDGLTGEAFAQPVAVGYMYILKLHHMIEDKMHARAIGPYSLITQQPLGGKSQSGGQRFGEMEVWALEGYGAAHTLREILTVKSDDINGRSAAFDSIIRGYNISHPQTPASFNVLLKNLRGLAMDVKLERPGFSYREGPETPRFVKADPIEVEEVKEEEEAETDIEAEIEAELSGEEEESKEQE